MKDLAPISSLSNDFRNRLQIGHAKTYNMPVFLNHRSDISRLARGLTQVYLSHDAHIVSS